MGGGLMQLVAYGAQDIYLTGNPQITFFKVVYRRHTNFAMEAIEQTFNGAASLGNKFSCTISRNGDLLGQVFLEMDVSLAQTSKSLKSITLKETISGTAEEETLNLANAAAADSFYLATNVLTVQTDNTGGAGADTLQIEVNASTDDYVYGAAAGAGQVLVGPTTATAITEVNGAQRVGQRAIEYVEVEIGGQCIDKHYGDWMDIWAGLTYSQEKWQKWNRMVNATLPANGSSDAKLYVPLQFWFCRNPGLALPLIALQYHEVKLNVQFASSVTYDHDTTPITNAELSANLSNNNLIAGKDFTDGAVVEINLTQTSTLSIDNCCVFCDYIFLDTDERRRFAQVSHEYLIEQVQYSNALNLSSGNTQHELRFNHPVKELLWSAQTTANKDKNFNYFGGSDADMINTALLQLNGHDRMKKRDGTYFRCVQPYQHHTGADGQDGASEFGGYYCYSFGLKPEEHQPSGTCNFSRIDNAVLSLNASADGQLKVYAMNYNVLRIMSGMGGLAYSN